MSVPQPTGETGVRERQLVARNDATDSENRIHDDAEAQRLGLRGGLVPGVTLYAYVTPLIVEAFGPEWLQQGGASVRFLRPVYDGDAIVCRLTPAAAGYEIAVLGSDGEPRALGTAVQHASAFEPPFADIETAPAFGDDERSELTCDTAPLGVRLRPRFVAIGGDEAAAYAGMAGDTSPLFQGDQPLVPPALLAAQPSRLLRENFSYGPSVHTRSEIHQLALARAGGVYRVDAVLRETLTRKDSDYVTADVLLRDAAGVSVAQIRHTVIFRYAPRR